MNSTAVTRRAQSIRLRRLVESAMMLAIATVLSMFPFQGLGAGGRYHCVLHAALGGAVLAVRLQVGRVCRLCVQLLQMVLGILNVQYADSVPTAILIILFDYVLAFSVIGLAGMFKGRLGNPRLELVLGIVLTFLVRLAATMSPAWWFGRCCGPMSWAGPRPSGPLPTTPAI